MRSNYIILGIILIIFSSLFFVGCSSEENKEINYEIISFENVPKEVQDRIRESDSNNSYTYEEYNSSGGINLGKERYVFFITNEGRVPKIIEVAPDKTYGRGIMIKHTAEYNENVEFPNTVTIVKLNNYYGEITNVFISHP